eukprot:460784-Pelagomonas_calceolata.AAC.2
MASSLSLEPCPAQAEAWWGFASAGTCSTVCLFVGTAAAVAHCCCCCTLLLRALLLLLRQKLPASARCSLFGALLPELAHAAAGSGPAPADGNELNSSPVWSSKNEAPPGESLLPHRWAGGGEPAPTHSPPDDIAAALADAWERAHVQVSSAHAHTFIEGHSHTSHSSTTLYVHSCTAHAHTYGHRYCFRASLCNTSAWPWHAGGWP